MLGDPKHIEELSVKYSKAAGHLSDSALALMSKVDHAQFEGPAADRWRHGMHARIIELQSLSDECKRISKRLHDASTGLAGELRHLHELERKVRHAFSTWDPLSGLMAPWHGLVRWSQHHLPEIGDPEWRTIAKHVGVA